MRPRGQFIIQMLKLISLIMDYKDQIINNLLNSFTDIRYVAVYLKNELTFKQRQQTADSSSSDTDKYEELLVNPILLTAARQRGNIDCGGLRFVIVAYGNFYQLIKEIDGGHISICLDKGVDLTNIPRLIFDSLKLRHPELFLWRAS
jgi:hypothetical protein